MAHVLEEDPVVYKKEKERFLKELQHFHETRGTPSRRTPRINGHEIDLYLLYNLVVSRGGWVKVNNRNEWGKILNSFIIPKTCVNGSVAIKQIYLRYLDRYEKVHFLGEIGERGGDDDEDSRHRRWSARSLHSVPLSYNHAQHNFNESLREYNGLSVDLYRESDYDKLALSLISPLPNEQDFAINVCMVLSNEGKHCLKLEKHPRILHYLMAHAAIFSDQSLKELFNQLYDVDRGYSTDYFWHDIVRDKEALKLTDLNIMEDLGLGAEGLGRKLKLHEEQSDSHLFCFRHTLGTHECFGQRVSQIATILHNLSFLQENAALMARDITFLRFTLMCCCSSWNSLSQTGWDMLSNIALDLLPSSSPLAYNLLMLSTKGVLSDDRAVILGSLDVLNKLSQVGSNETLLLNILSQEIYNRLCSFLTLHDIMLLVYTLECLNAITSLGEKACNAVVKVKGAIDVLVSLITVEAQSYGPKACIQMKVVETVVSGNTSWNNIVNASVGPENTSVNTSLISTSSNSNVGTNNHSHVTLTPSASVVTTLAGSNVSFSHPSTFSCGNQTSVASCSTTTISTTNLQKTLATQQVAQENEQFALAWLRSTFEPQTGKSIEQAELYKQYINYCAGIGRRGVIAPLHFPRCVRSVFGGNIGPRTVTVSDSVQYHYDGIKLRNKPILPVRPLVSILPTTPSPILKAQLSAPPKPSVPVSPPPLITHRHVLTQMRFSQPSNNTLKINSLIRPLLEKTPNPSTKVLTNFKVNGMRTDVTEKSEEQNEAVNVNENHLNKPTPSVQLSRKEQSRLPCIPTNNEDVSASNILLKHNVCDKVSEGGLKSDEIVLNGVTSLEASENASQDSSNTTKVASDSSTKSLMLADLLEKSIENKEPPSLNGALRLVERGLELAQTAGQMNGSVSCSASPTSTAIISNHDLKRSNPFTSRDAPKAKMPCLNGDVIKEDKLSEGASLVDDVEGEPPTITESSSKRVAPPTATTDNVVQPHVLMHTGVSSASQQTRQILVSTGAGLTQRVVVGGQHYVVAQPQTALVQHGAQAVFLTQTTQHQGSGGAKTIIILQPQSVATGGGSMAGKVQLMQRIGTSPLPSSALLSCASRKPVMPNHVTLPSAPVQSVTTPIHQSRISISNNLNKVGMISSANVEVGIVANASIGVANLSNSGGAVANPSTESTDSNNSEETASNATIGLFNSSNSTGSLVANTSIGNTNLTFSGGIATNATIGSTNLSNSYVGNTVLTSTNVGSVAMPAIPAPCATPVSIISTAKTSSVTTNSGPCPVSATTTVMTASVTTTSNIPSKATNENQQGHFLCEWRDCMRNFKSGNEVYMHACETHCPQDSQEIQCLWERCDAMKRKRFSLMTHLYDKHCNADVMKMMAVRRKQLSASGRTEIPAPVYAAPHPGYAPNAAFHAIKRHALEFVNPKELQDDNEGPVTKSIRLTAALILRNLVIYSASGKRCLSRYEPHLASVALSNVESSRTLAHVLFDMCSR